MSTAKELKKLSDSEWSGDARLYAVEPPLPAYSGQLAHFVVASAVIASGGRPETYLFPANGEGDVLSWTELPGSLKDTLSHQAVFARLGYDVEIA